MSKPLKIIGTVAAGVALVATGVGAFAVAGSALAATAGTVSTIAGLAAGVAQIGSRITAKKPPARGSITQTIIAAEPPRPYLMGKCYSAGVMRHRVGYGATLKKVPNPYLWIPVVYSGVGPCKAITEKQFDFKSITSYYSGFYDTDDQLGLRPEATALVPPYGAAPGWTSASKLSGCLAIGWNFKFDKDGKVYASGLPAYGGVFKGEFAYDPRLDSSQPGGSGTHVLGDESTYAYTKNPALHAATYAYGRYESGIKIFGIGIDGDGIDWSAVASWANDCDTNDWEIHGSIYEGGDQSGPGVKAQNLDDICAAGGARWFTSGAVLTFDWHRPRVSLATFTDKDIMEAGVDLVTLQSHRDRFNTVRPQYRSEDHNWELITADKIASSTWVTEDGQEKAQTWPFNLVTDADQAGQLGTYAMADSREMGPITIPLGIDWGFYRPGNTLTWDSEILDETLKLVIIDRTTNPVTLETSFTFKTETASKHAYALGETAVAPPTPVIGQTGEERDAVAGYAADPRGAFRIRSYSPAYPITPGDGEIDIEAFTGTLEDGRSIAFPAETDSTLAVSSFFSIFWDLIDEEYLFETAPGTTQMESSRYVFVGSAKTSSSGTFPSDPTPPDGWSNDPNQQEP